MSSKIEICNLTLRHFGMKRITSLTDGNPSANILNDFFDVSRDDVYREFMWPFASVQKLLATATEEIVGWNYVYAYPIQAATIWNVYNESTVKNKEEQDFEVMYSPDNNRKIICSNLSVAYADITYKISDTTLFDPKFVMALSYKLAAMTAHDLTGDIEKGQVMLEAYQGVISEAKRISYIERKKKITLTSSQIEARG